MKKSVQQQLQNISSNNLVEFKIYLKYNLDYNLFLEEIKIEMVWQNLFIQYIIKK